MSSQPAARLIPIATMTLTLRAPVVLEESPSGTRWIVEAAAGRIEGERLRGVVKGHANADWFTIGPNKVGTIDARLLLETDDGALILTQYTGRADLAIAGSPIFIAPRFETSHENYRWLNSVQAVGKGLFEDRSTLVYELFEVA